MSPALRQSLLELVKPLSLAAYAAWAAVWFSLDGLVARDPAAGWLARACALAFLIGFMADDWLCPRLSRFGFAAFGVLLALLALVPVALVPYGAGPILLVLLAALLAARFEGRGLTLVLTALALALAATVWTWWPASTRQLLIMLAAYISFMLFAALVMRYAVQAETMAEQLRAVNADLVATRSLLAESARDAERLRLSRELHDVAGHALTALKLNLGALARDSRQPDRERVELCAGLADELLQDLRAVVRQMRAHEGIDLGPAIERLAAPFPKPQVHVELDPNARVSELDRAEALLRAVQEGLTNAARHAAANNLWLTLRREGDRLRLELRDDGRGASGLIEGHGLRGMRERMQALGGELVVGRAPEGGLQLVATLPAVAP